MMHLSNFRACVSYLVGWVPVQVFCSLLRGVAIFLLLICVSVCIVQVYACVCAGTSVGGYAGVCMWGCVTCVYVCIWRAENDLDCCSTIGIYLVFKVKEVREGTWLPSVTDSSISVKYWFSKMCATMAPPVKMCVMGSRTQYLVIVRPPLLLSAPQSYWSPFYLIYSFCHYLTYWSSNLNNYITSVYWGC